jgi:hypothetical protein
MPHKHKKARDEPFWRNFLTTTGAGVAIVRVIPVEVDLRVVRIPIAIRNLATPKPLLPTFVCITEHRLHNALS